MFWPLMVPNVRAVGGATAAEASPRILPGGGVVVLPLTAVCSIESAGRFAATCVLAIVEASLRRTTWRWCMSTLVVVSYDTEFQAEEVRLKLRKLQKDYLIDLEDAVVATKDAKGKVKLHQAMNLTGAGALSGGFWGALIGLIFMMPLLGAAVGASAGAISGALTDLGIDDDFMKNLASQMKPGGSVLFALARGATPDKVLEELQGTGGTILKTSLTHEDEAKLQAALSAAKP